MDKRDAEIVAAILVAGRITAMQKGVDEQEMAIQWARMVMLVTAQAAKSGGSGSAGTR